MGQVIILMGVAGSGKSTIGELLAVKLGWPFYDGDDFMPQENVAKMAAGQPLTDEDRKPWLAILNELIRTHLDSGRSLIVASSALKRSYRRQLSDGIAEKQIYFVHLKGDFWLIKERLENRQGHFMKAGMLSSQFETLEEPRQALEVDVALAPEAIVERIRAALNPIRS